jgi:hypothetical protein
MIHGEGVPVKNLLQALASVYEAAGIDDESLARCKTRDKRE